MKSIISPAISWPSMGATGPSRVTTPPRSWADENDAASRLAATMSS